MKPMPFVIGFVMIALYSEYQTYKTNKYLKNQDEKYRQQIKEMYDKYKTF